MVHKAGTLLIPSGPSHDPDRLHLHIVCTNPCNEGKQLIVSVTGWINDLCDNSCILMPGDHPFIIKKSYVFYRRTSIKTVEELDVGIKYNYFFLKDPMEMEVFQRVCVGLLKSKFTRPKFKTYFKKNC